MSSPRFRFCNVSCRRSFQQHSSLSFHVPQYPPTSNLDNVAIRSMIKFGWSIKIGTSTDVRDRVKIMKFHYEKNANKFKNDQSGLMELIADFNLLKYFGHGPKKITFTPFIQRSRHYFVC